MATLAELNAGDVVVAVEPVHPIYIGDNNKVKPKQLGLLISKDDQQGTLIVRDGGRKYVRTGSVFRRTRKDTREKFFRELNLEKIEFVRSHGHLSGCDPEVFAVDEHGTIIPAFKYLPHKDKANAVTCNNDDGRGSVKAFYDGFQAEFTTSAQSCHAWMVDYVWAGLREVYNALKKHYPKADLTWKTVMEVPAELMAQAPRDGVDMGCAPSINAYGKAAPALGKVQPEEVPFRFAGVHYHIGKKNPPEVNINRVKTMDAFVGVASVAAFRGMEDPRRRQFYGTAGEYREPKHGLEYRVLSSAVIAHPALTHLFFDMLRTADIAGEQGLRSLYSASDEEVCACINNYDVDLAVKLVNTNRSLYESMLKMIYNYFGNYNTVVNNAMRIILEGAVNVLPTESMTKNWRLAGVRRQRSYTGDTDWATHSEAPNCCMHTLKL